MLALLWLAMRLVLFISGDMTDDIATSFVGIDEAWEVLPFFPASGGTHWLPDAFLAVKRQSISFLDLNPRIASPYLQRTKLRVSFFFFYEKTASREGRDAVCSK